MRATRWAVLLGTMALAVPAAASVPDKAGPYNAHFMSGGIGVTNDLPVGAAIAGAGHAFTLSAWVRPEARQSGAVTLIALGDPAGATRALLLIDGRLAYRADDKTITGAALPASTWTNVAAVSDGATVSPLRQRPKSRWRRFCRRAGRGEDRGRAGDRRAPHFAGLWSMRKRTTPR